MALLLQPCEPQPQVIPECREVPDLDNVLGALTSRLPSQTLQPEACALIRRIFNNLAEAHRYQTKAAKEISYLVSLVLPEQLTMILSEAVPPVIHLVLPPGTTSPLAAPPPQPTTRDTVAGRQEIVKFCKSKILPDPKATSLLEYDIKSPTRVLAAALFCKIERKYFDEKTSRADIAAMFRVTTAQLTKAVTGVDYKSGPHSATKKKTPGTDSTKPIKLTQSQATSSTNPTTSNITGQAKRKHVELATTSQPPQKRQKVTEPSRTMKAYDEKIPKDTDKADDTLTSSKSSDELPLCPF